MPLENSSHESVLKNEVLNFFMTSETKTVFDGTLGLGGHAEIILKEFPQVDRYIGVDLDKQHLQFAQQRLKPWQEKTVFKNDNFSSVKCIVEALEVPRPLVILLDLGLCSNQVDDPQKGFSFRQTGPLNMAFDEKNKGRCETIVNTESEQKLQEIFKLYGEEPASHKIARNIIKTRQQTPIKTTEALKEIIENSVHPKVQKKTLMRVFQALRIETNQELEHLEKALQDAYSVLQPRDRFGVMSFHSLEDRMVKQFFKKITTPKTTETAFSLHTEVEPATAKLLTKSPIVPTKEEIETNPRARSVKFRIIEKI